MKKRFPDQDIGLSVIPFDQDNVPPHGHDFTELVVITGGKGFHVTSTQRYPLMAGDVFVIKKGETHCYQGTDQLSLVNILYYEDVLQIQDYDIRNLPGYHALFCIEPQFREKHNFKSKLNLDLENLTVLKEKIALLNSELKEEKPGYYYVSISLFMSIIAQLSRYYSDYRSKNSSTRFTWQIAKVISYLENHYPENITLEELAKMANMSISSLRRAFIEITQKSPIDYLIHLRLSKAAEQLKNTQKSISEIAYDVGFTDSNYFTRQFKKFTNKSPRVYRVG